MKIYFLCNKTASRLWRMNPQAKLMKQLGHETRVEEYIGKPNMDAIAWADLIISEMVFDWRLIDAIKKGRKKLIYECDDLQETTHKKHYAYKDTVGLKGLKRKYWIYKFMKNADAIIVTNKELKKHYKFLSRLGKEKKIYMLPNYMDMSYWNQPTMPNSSGKLRILWSGGGSHTGDLEWIVPPLKKFLEKYPKAEFVYVGHGGWREDGSPIVEYNYGEFLFEDLPKNQIRMELGTEMNLYATKLSLMQCDVGIAPVENNKFSRHKTPIKALEYGINYMPTIGSEFLYKGAIIHGETGFLAKNQEDFYKYLCYFADNPAKIGEMGDKAYQHVLDNYNIEKHIGKWKQVFESVF